MKIHSKLLKTIQICSGGGLLRGEGCLLPGGLLGGGGIIPACTEADPSPVNRITDMCKNINFVAGGKNTAIFRKVFFLSYLTTNGGVHSEPISFPLSD